MSKSSGLILAVIAGLISCSCDEAVPTVPTQQTQTTNVTVTIHPPPTVNPSPSPNPTGCRRDQILSVRVNPFGYSCPSGTSVPNNSSGLLPRGCTAATTATPKGDPSVYPPNGDLPVAVHGTDIVWAIVTGQDRITFVEDPSNRFNVNVTVREGSAPGDFQLSATVCGVTGSWVGRTI